MGCCVRNAIVLIFWRYMRGVTEELIQDFKIMELGYDMMGYTVEKKTQLSFHHLLVARRYCQALGLGDGYFYWNGGILRQNTSHDYLHIIERLEPELFYLITSEILDEKAKGFIDKENLIKIREMLLYFESKHRYDTCSTGALLLKKKYYTNRVGL